MSGSSSVGLWIKRLAVALVAGVGVGAGTGLVGLKVLSGSAAPPVVEPEPTEPETPAPRRVIRGPRADGMRAGGGSGALVGGGRLASRDSIAVVPDLIGRAEGDARRLLQRAGFTLGSVGFREADEPTGSVLETYPPRGDRVQLPATVNIILADRRRVVDTLGNPYAGSNVFRIPDTLPEPARDPVLEPVPAPAPDTAAFPSAPRLPDSALVIPDTLP